MYFAGERAYFIEKDSELQKAMRETFLRVTSASNHAETIPVYKEKGIYNMYVKEQREGEARALCPIENASGGNRRGRRRGRRL